MDMQLVLTPNRPKSAYPLPQALSEFAPQMNIFCPKYEKRLSLNPERTKGLCYLGILVLAIAYFLYRGFADLAGLFTLGTKEADTWLGVQGDNSVVMLLMGILATRIPR